MPTRANKKLIAIRAFFFLLLILCLFAVGARSQQIGTQKVKANIDLPVWQGYKGVTIGMTAAEVRTKLGAPKSEDADGYFYSVSETETAQVLLDAEKKVRVILVSYSAEHLNQPKYTDIFDKSVTLEARPDGAAYKMVRYEGAGYWVSYSRLAGEKAMVIVMIQKL